MKRLIATLAAVQMFASCSGPVSTLDVAILVKNKGAENRNRNHLMQYE